MEVSNLGRNKNKMFSILMYIFLSLWCGFTIFTMVWIINTSFKTNQDMFQSVWGLTKGFNISNYLKAWNVVDMRRYFLNSLMIVMPSIFILIFICTPAAYVLSRFNFRGIGVLNKFFIIGMGVPYQLLIIPLYGLFIKIHLADSIPGLILVYVSLSLPFTIFILTGFLRSLPTELEEAAIIDGCSVFGAFWKVIFPLASPGIICASIFNFIILWNEYMLALIFISSPEKRPISLGFYFLQNTMQFNSDWTAMFAGSVILMVPSLILFILLAEKIMSGLTLGAVKG